MDEITKQIPPTNTLYVSPLEVEDIRKWLEEIDGGNKSEPRMSTEAEQGYQRAPAGVPPAQANFGDSCASISCSRLSPGRRFS